MKSPGEDKKDKPIALQISDLADLEAGGGSSLPKNQKDPKANPLQNNLKMQLQRQLTIKVEKELERVNEQLKLEPPVDPEYILWDNIGFTDASRRMRRGLSVAIASLIILCSGGLVLAFKQQEDGILQQQVDCGSITISKQTALRDQQDWPSRSNRADEDRETSPGMSCYCQE